MMPWYKLVGLVIFVLAALGFIEFLLWVEW